MPPALEIDPAQGHPDFRRGLALLGIGLSVFMGTMDISIVVIALPTLMHDLGASLASVEWVVVSYALVITSLMLGVGRLGDMFGKKLVYLVGIAVFGAGSALCGLATSVWTLIAFRGVQALGAVMMQALGMGIVTEIFPAGQRGRVMGIIGTAVSLGLAVGHPLGGLLVGTVGWRAIFWVNLPVCLISWYMVLRYVPGDHHSGKGERFDLAGALLLFSALICYALAMTLGQHHGFSSGASPLLFLAAAVGVALFLWVEARSAQPMMPLSLFRDPEYALGLVMSWNSFLILGGMFILPIYLQAAEGYSPQQAGFLMLVVPVCMGIVSHPAGWCADRFGPRLVSLAGLVLLVLGCLTISGITLHLSVTEYVLRTLPLGLGLGLFQVPNNSSIMGRSPRNRLGVSSGLVSLSRTLGNTSGVPLMGAVFSVYLLAAAPGLDPDKLMTAPPQALVAGLDGVFGMAAWLGSSSIAVGMAAWWLERRRRGEAPTARTGR